MPAVVQPLPPVSIALEVHADAPKLFYAKCADCIWYPSDDPVDEATARIAAYEHNAVKHPDAIVEVESLAQSHAAGTRLIRRRIRRAIVMTVIPVVAQTFVAFTIGSPIVATFPLVVWTVVAVLHAMDIGLWTERLRDHHRHPPGTFVVSARPVDDEQDET